MKIMNFILCALISILFFGCGQYKAANGTSNSGSIDTTPTPEQRAPAETPDDIPTPPQIENSLSFEGEIKSPILGNHQIVSYNAETSNLEVSLPLPAIGTLGAEVSGILPDFPGISLASNQNGSLIVLNIPLEDYIGLVRKPSSLPSGRALPGIPGGESPDFGLPLSIGDVKGYGFAAPDYFALFTEINIDPFVELRFPIKTGVNSQTIGFVDLLRPKDGEKGGVFLSFQLPRELTLLIESLL